MKILLRDDNAINYGFDTDLKKISSIWNDEEQINIVFENGDELSLTAYNERQAEAILMDLYRPDGQVMYKVKKVIYIPADYKRSIFLIKKSGGIK